MEKISIKSMSVQQSFEKMKPQLCFFFLKTFSSCYLFILHHLELLFSEAVMQYKVEKQI